MFQMFERHVFVDKDVEDDLNTKTKQAIDQASCVLICMTEKYNENVSCKYAAEYTVSKKKPFVPLLIQRSFQPKGW